MTIGSVLAEMPKGDPAEAVVAARWNEIVGTTWGPRCGVASLEQGVLTVEAMSSIQWELGLEKEKLRIRLNEYLGADIIKEVRITMRTTRGR